MSRASCTTAQVRGAAAKHSAASCISPLRSTLLSHGFERFHLPACAPRSTLQRAAAAISGALVCHPGAIPTCSGISPWLPHRQNALA